MSGADVVQTGVKRHPKTEKNKAEGKDESKSCSEDGMLREDGKSSCTIVFDEQREARHSSCTEGVNVRTTGAGEKDEYEL